MKKSISGIVFLIFFRNFAAMKAKSTYILLFFLLMSLSASAQKDFFLFKAARAVKNYLDSSVIKSVDSNYIVVPKRPWQLILRHNIHQMRINMHSVQESETEFLNWSPTLRTHTSNNIGLWIGYRGYGFGYSINLSKNTGKHFTLGAIGESFGINLRLRRFNTRDVNADIYLYEKDEGVVAFNGNHDLQFTDPIRVHSLMIDGYYMFNSKRFSYAAAYDQSAIQIRSAGSFMVGALWNAMSVRYNTDKNAILVDLMSNVGAFKVRQGSLGAGYAYNWVPVRGLLVNAMFMPMVTLYNRQVVTQYETDFGETEMEDALYDEKESTRWSRVTLTFNGRASITYNFERFFFNIYGQFNTHRYDYGDEGDGRVKDWFVNTSIGVRF